MKRLIKKVANTPMIKFTIYKGGEIEEVCYVLIGENRADDVCYYVKSGMIYPNDEVMEHWLFEMYERQEERDYENKITQEYCNIDDFKKEHGEEIFSKMLNEAEESKSIWDINQKG